MALKQGYFVTDDGMMAYQGLTTLSEALRAAERTIRDLPFGEIGRFEILLREGTTTKVVRRFEPVIDWEEINK